MIRWNPRFVKIMTVIGAISAFLVASGAGSRWS